MTGRRITATVPEPVYAWLKAAAERQQRPLGAVITALVAANPWSDLPEADRQTFREFSRIKRHPAA